MPLPMPNYSAKEALQEKASNCVLFYLHSICNHARPTASMYWRQIL